MKKIKTETEHKKALAQILRLMNKGEGNLTEKENAKVRSMALAVQSYEQENYPVTPPKTIAGMMELKMYEKRLTQLQLAKKLAMSETKLSMIMNGKQKPDVAFLKGIRKELNISADFILDNV